MRKAGVSSGSPWIALVGVSEAEASFREAIGLYSGLVAQAPKVLIYREEYAVCKNGLGELLIELGRSAEAETMYREAIAIYERLIADVPTNPIYGMHLAIALADLADALADRRDFMTAIKLLGRASPLIDVALKANPDRAEYKRALRTNRLIEARCRAGLGDSTTTLEIAESIGRLGFDKGADNYASARALARCIPPAGHDDPFHFADRAMATLNRAVAAGFHDTDALRENHDLDRLRERDDFRLLMMDLAFPAMPLAHEH